MISEAEYCSRVCGARCCTVDFDGHTCRHLGSDKLCTVYERRFGPGSPVAETMYFYKSKKRKPNGLRIVRPLVCSRMTLLHERGLVPPAMAEQCCVIHPELLEKDYD